MRQLQETAVVKSEKVFIPLTLDGKQQDQSGLITLAIRLINRELRREKMGLPPLRIISRAIDTLSGMISVDGRGTR